MSPKALAALFVRRQITIEQMRRSLDIAEKARKAALVSIQKLNRALKLP